PVPRVLCKTQPTRPVPALLPKKRRNQNRTSSHMKHDIQFGEVSEGTRKQF
ncbi:MAG: hypothetical protein EZS28_046327, partial [Streblomastix strix]